MMGFLPRCPSIRRNRLLSKITRWSCSGVLLLRGNKQRWRAEGFVVALLRNVMFKKVASVLEASEATQCFGWHVVSATTAGNENGRLRIQCAASRDNNKLINTNTTTATTTTATTTTNQKVSIWMHGHAWRWHEQTVVPVLQRSESRKRDEKSFIARLTLF